MPRASFAYNPHPAPHLYLPAGWDSGWRSAKAAAASAPIYLQAIGDSISTGQGAASNCMTTSWLGRLKSSLLSTLGIPLAAEYLPAYGMSNLAGTLNSPPWSNYLNSRTPTMTASVGWHRASYDNGGASAVSHQLLTAPFNCTALDICYVDYQSGTWQYSIDGGANVTVTNTAASTAPANTAVKKISLTGLSSAAHTVAYGWQSASLVAIIQGVTCWANGNNPSNGLCLARMVNGGAAAYEWLTSGQGPANRARLYMGCVPQSDSGTGTAFGYPMQTSLAIIQLGINDATQYTQSSPGSSDWQLVNVYGQMIQGIRRVNPNASILLLSANSPDLASDSTPLSLNAQFYPAYLAAIWRVANTYNCAWVNMQQKWGETPYAQGFLPNNDLHPTDAGHQDIANTILSLL